MSRDTSDQLYRPPPSVPADTLRRPADPPSLAACAAFGVAVVGVVVAASYPLATVAVAATYGIARAVLVTVRRRASRSDDGTAFRFPGVVVEVTVTRTDGD